MKRCLEASSITVYLSSSIPALQDFGTYLSQVATFRQALLEYHNPLDIPFTIHILFIESVLPKKMVQRRRIPVKFIFLTEFTVKFI